VIFYFRRLRPILIPEIQTRAGKNKCAGRNNFLKIGNFCAPAADFTAATARRFEADSPRPLHFDDTLAARRGLTARPLA
jgi:hypothetical protein